MTALASYRDTPSADAAAPAPARPWATVSVSGTIAPVADAWRMLEETGLVTPYQSLGWVGGFVETVGAAQGASFRFALVSGRDGAPLALLPLAISPSGPLRIAGFVGGKHANYHMGLFDPAFAAALTPATVRLLLGEVAAAIGGLDALVFINQPPEWHGHVNPLALLPHDPSPSAAYRLALTPDEPEAALRRSMSPHAHKKLRNKRNRFATLGRSSFVRARTEAEIERVADAFLAQKAARFAQMGIADPFAEPGMRAFIVSAAGGDAPAIELYSLDLDGHSVATYVGAVQGGRFSGMATAFALDSEAAKTSPGEILLIDLILAKSAEGFTEFDLGVGKARYKTTVCDERDALVDCVLPLTARGRAFALLSRAKQGLKRRIKASPAALKLAQKVSGLFARRRTAAGEE